MNEAKIKGLTTELLVQAYLTKLGYNVSVPLGEDCRYDLILDIDNLLLRVQIKTCTEKNNGIEFSIRSVRMNNQGYQVQSYDKEQIDLFATYYKDKCYLVPVEICGTSSKTLTFDKQITSNTQVTLLENCEAEKVIDKIINKTTDQLVESKNTVYQYDLQNHLIAIYDSCSAAGKALGKPSGGAHIGQVIKGQRKTAYGFKWSNTLITE